MAIAYILIGIICGTFAGTLTLLAEGSLLTAFLMYAGIGQIATISAAGFSYLRPQSFSVRD